MEEQATIKRLNEALIRAEGEVSIWKERYFRQMKLTLDAIDELDPSKRSWFLDRMPEIEEAERYRRSLQIVLNQNDQMAKRLRELEPECKVVSASDAWAMKSAGTETETA